MASSPVDTLTRRPSREVLVWAATLLAVAGIMVAISVVVTRMSNDAHRPEAAASEVTPVAPPVAVDDAAVVPVAADLVLPQATSYAGGVPTGYPNTVPGAVAAAYGYSRIATGLDVDSTLRTLQTIADPTSDWFPADRAEIADGLVAQRRNLGLAATGPNSGALIAVHPSGYRIEHSVRGTVTVLTLNVVDTQTVDGTSATGTVVFRWALRWDGKQWLATETFLDAADENLAFTPMTSGATAKGWKVARGG